MSPDQLTAEQRETVRELQEELRTLDLQSDIAWAKYLHTNDVDCYNEALALDGEREMKGLIAYIPKAGELKISKIRKLVSKIKGVVDEPCDGCDLGKDEVRLTALESVNEWRATYDLPPLPRMPRGIPGDGSECTFAKAFRISAVELGWQDIEVDVSGGNSMSIHAHTPKGFVDVSPEFTAEQERAAAHLIKEFDENAWLDLLNDSALERYAESVVIGDFSEYDEYPEILTRLQEVSDEAAARTEPTLTFTVTGNLPNPDTDPYGDDGTRAMELSLGYGCDPVRDQVIAEFAKEIAE